MTDSTRSFFRTLEKVLLRCWIFGFALQLISLAILLLTGSIIDSIHGPLFGLTPHEIDVIIYCGMGLLKLAVLVCFFIPWLSIRLVLKKESRSSD